ncbi:hypothetical protein BLSMQ_0687 [Brevibacterium aurantiacum]|uniref:Uncharacterized protein n=1 Tax=Brevibacterium aurantiacum TaxID=273384 RepID=A0A1D7W040_BREAU|nr:hypothetical protein BLSMQ_0687 [Brevibacterium aurantiacum]
MISSGIGVSGGSEAPAFHVADSLVEITSVDSQAVIRPIP